MDLLIAANSVPLSGADVVPASGTPQYATDGNPAANVPATIAPAYHYNMMMAEMLAVVRAAGETPSGNNWTQLLTALQTLFGHGRLLNVQVFATAGSLVYAATPGTSTVLVEVVGGGGPGGSAANTGANQLSAGAGGAAGGYSRKRLVAGFNGATVTVGAAGVAGTAGLSGTNGGASSFGSAVSAIGGNAGSIGPALTAVGYPQGGASSGVGVGGDVNAAGEVGGYAIYTNPATSGKGGASYFGGGGSYTTGSSSGLAAASPGAGGGGGVQSVPNASGATGGAAQPGIVIVWELS